MASKGTKTMTNAKFISSLTHFTQLEYFLNRLPYCTKSLEKYYSRKIFYY